MIEKILLVDDDVPSNYYHRIVLRDSGQVKEIVDCLGVDEAMTSLRSGESPPDIILLDINMPIKSGWDFLEEYATLDPSMRAKRVFILSTTRLTEDLERAKNYPWVSGFLLKPFTRENIEGLIQQLG